MELLFKFRMRDSFHSISVILYAMQLLIISKFLLCCIDKLLLFYDQHNGWKLIFLCLHYMDPVVEHLSGVI